MILDPEIKNGCTFNYSLVNSLGIPFFTSSDSPVIELSSAAKKIKIIIINK